MTLAELRKIAETLPPGATLTLPRDALLRLTEEAAVTPARNGNAAPTWRERLWTCPPETRLGVLEVAEALGRPRSWVYRAVSPSRGRDRLPAKRLDGELVFEAGAVREWVKRRELPMGAR
ncbi:MAG: hypothetical protein KatS3mg081_0556 [Gemmatimonadales bacterium]|nr:MAG: hypothetical protein KatS3mg081_0556 [Gemmatimonadales bacterium]